MTERDISREEARGLRSAKELEGHLGWLDSFTPAALGVLEREAIANGSLELSTIVVLLHYLFTIKRFATRANGLLH